MADEPSGNGSEPSEPSGTELDRFQALAKKLVSVPKAEIDAARRAAKRGRLAKVSKHR